MGIGCGRSGRPEACLFLPWNRGPVGIPAEIVCEWVASFVAEGIWLRGIEVDSTFTVGGLDTVGLVGIISWPVLAAQPFV